jgi:hypothetical protein
MARAGLGIGHWVYPHGLSSSKVHPAPERHFGKDQKMKWLLFMTMLAGLILGSVIAAKAQSTGSYLIPYGMSAGMQVLDRAMQPRPAAAPTPEVNAGGYGAQAGDRRLVCEQWNGQRWQVINVPAQRCQP